MTPRPGHLSSGGPRVPSCTIEPFKCYERWMLFWLWLPEDAILSGYSSVSQASSFHWLGPGGPLVIRGPVLQSIHVKFRLIYFQMHLICSCEWKKKNSLHLISWICLSPSPVLLVSKTGGLRLKADRGRVLEVPLVTRIAPWFHEWGTSRVRDSISESTLDPGKRCWTLLWTKQRLMTLMWDYSELIKIKKITFARLRVCLEITALLQWSEWAGVCVCVRGTAAAASVIWSSNLGRALEFKMVWIW